eukprot:1377896-Amorphochlora_amoeboformis.AAC.1
MNAEVEEAEAARTIAHISSMDSWLSQLEQGLGSQRKRYGGRVVQCLIVVHLLNKTEFGEKMGICAHNIPELLEHTRIVGKVHLIFLSPDTTGCYRVLPLRRSPRIL